VNVVVDQWHTKSQWLKQLSGHDFSMIHPGVSSVISWIVTKHEINVYILVSDT
jgi:hypothetical protein